MKSNWLRELKAGDRVIIVRWNDLDEVAAVERVTATQITVGKRRFQKRTGKLVGGSAYTSSWLGEYSEERAEKIERLHRRRSNIQLIARFASTRDLPDEHLQIVADAIRGLSPATID